MDRRESLKALIVGGISSSVLLDACKQPAKEGAEVKEGEKAVVHPDRMAEENVADKQVMDQPKFFTENEMATITILGDIIIPKDQVRGSASDAKVPDFFDFLVKDYAKN